MRVVVGFENIQVRDEDGLQTGCLEVCEDGTVRFAPLDSVHPAPPNEAVKGSLGEFEEVEEPVPTE